MSDQAAIHLLVDDMSVLSSLRFALSVEGFVVAEDVDVGAERNPNETLVVDERYDGDGLAFLARLRARNCHAPAIVLATNPTTRLRSSILALNAVLIEKPLLGDDLSRAILSANDTRRAA